MEKSFEKARQYYFYSDLKKAFDSKQISSNTKTYSNNYCLENLHCTPEKKVLYQLPCM